MDLDSHLRLALAAVTKHTDSVEPKQLRQADLDGAILHMVVSINGDTPIAGWFIMENPIKVDDLGVLPF